MINKLIATGAIVAGLAFLAPSGASAASLAGTYDVPAGSTVCITSPDYAYSYSRADGNVVAGHLVRFKFRTAGPTFNTLADTGGPVSAFAAEATPYLYPWAFPGRFQVCAVNQSLKPSTVYLGLQTS